MSKMTNRKVEQLVDLTPYYRLPRKYGLRWVLKHLLKTIVSIAKLPSIIYIALRDKVDSAEFWRRISDVFVTKERNIYNYPNINLLKQVKGYLQISLFKLLSYLPLVNLYSTSNMSRLIEQNIFRHDDLRQVFDHRIMDIQLLPQSRNHTHQRAAALRTSVNIALVNIAKEAGYRPYVVSYSNSDNNMGLAGCRNFYWPKDLSIPHRDDVVEPGDCFVMIDVDYYVDINDYLKKFKPILLYTFCPKKVCGIDEVNGHSYMIADDVVYYEVVGGGNYCHRLWEYSGDTVSIIDDNGSLLTYDMTQKELKGYPDRRIITILPRTCTPWPYYSILSNYGDGIRYLNITQSPGIINVLHDPMTDVTSLSMNYSNQSIELKSRLLIALKHRICQKKTTSPEIGDLETMLVHELALEKEQIQIIEKMNSLVAPKEPYKRRKVPAVTPCLQNCKITAALLHQILPWLHHITFNQTSTTEIKTVPLTFNALGPITMEDSKTPCVAISSPLASNPATAPVRSINNQLAAVQNRVVKNCNVVVPNRKFKNYADEFVDLVVPKEGVVMPLDHSVIIELQKRPSQKARTALVFDTLGVDANNALKSFIKGEAYEVMNDPRVITQMKPELTINMSRFTYAFKYECLKCLPWYAPGKTPLEVMERIGEIAEHGLIDTDYSRFDGTISHFLQYSVVLPCYLKALLPAERANFVKLFDSVFKQKARTESGLPYDACFGTRSGSPLTTDGNTIINAYIGYCALRELGRSKLDSWKELGIYGGDDGLTPNSPLVASSIEKVATDLGLVVKMSVHGVDEPVPFLGRIIPRPFTSKDSHQDVLRTIPKLHLTFNKNVSLDQAGYNKAFGYLITDGKTPIIKEWALTIMELSKSDVMHNARPDEELKATLAWPQTDHDLIEWSVARQFECTITELRQKCELISLAKGPFPVDMPVIYDNGSKNHKLDGVVGDQLISQSGNRVKNTTDFNSKCHKTHANCAKHSDLGVEMEQSISPGPSSSTLISDKDGKRKEQLLLPSTSKRSEISQISSANICLQRKMKSSKHSLLKTSDESLAKIMPDERKADDSRRVMKKPSSASKTKRTSRVQARRPKKI